MQRPSHVYVGAARAGSRFQGGIFRRGVDGGEWQQLTQGLPDETQVQAITPHPSRARRAVHRHAHRRLPQRRRRR